MNLSSLGGVVDFAPKADFFSLNVLGAGLIFLAVAAWLRASFGRRCGRRDLLFVVAAMVVPYVVVAGSWRLDRLSFGVTTLVLVIAGAIERRLAASRALAAPPSRETTHAGSTRERWMIRAATLALLGVLVFNCLDSRLWVHYDYFSQSISAIDLGLNGRSPSAWMSSWDPSRWFVVSQAIMPVFDAAEVALNGTVTTTLSQLFLALLMILLMRAAPRQVLNYVVLVAVLGLYLIDYNRAPRPHVFVGVLSGLFLLRLTAGARWRELAVYLLLLALSKRDGLALAAVIPAIYLLEFAYRRLGWKAMAVLAVIFVSGIALLLNSWVALWTRTPLDALIFALSRANYVDLIMRPEVAQCLIAGTVVIAAMIFARVPARAMLIPALLTAYVLVSAITVDGMENYNFGTILRKLFYMQAPVLLCGLLLARERLVAALPGANEPVAAT